MGFILFFQYLTNFLFAQVPKAESRRLRIARARQVWWSEEVARLVKANGGGQQVRTLKHYSLLEPSWPNRQFFL